ncbi:tetratricopeptide repeat protein [Clostridiaceae bacterium OttesenSCG-928-D20]|nr:tetratricopeptide repeat protein [Clostridiaceae bacterium OttesenSCG-928-D20]
MKKTVFVAIVLVLALLFAGCSADFDTLLEKAQNLAAEGNYEKAFKSFDKLMEKVEDPKNEMADKKITLFLAIGDAYLQKGEFQTGLDYYLDAIENETDNEKKISLLKDIGEICVDNGELSKGIELYLNASVLDPENHLIWERLSELYKESGELELEAEAFEKAIFLNEDITEPWERLEEYHKAHGNLELLAGFYEAALTQFPYEVKYVNSLLKTYYMQENLEAVSNLVKAQSNSPMGLVLEYGEKINRLMLDGKDAEIKEMLEDIKLVKTMLAALDDNVWYFGQYDENGESAGKGVRFYIPQDVPFNLNTTHIYYGDWKNSERSGEGTAVKIYHNENSTHDTGKMELESIQTEACFFDGIWENDLANGEYECTRHWKITMKDSSYSQYDYDMMITKTGAMKNGKGEGEMIESTEFVKPELDPTKLIHFLADGYPVSFEHSAFPGEKVLHIEEYSGPHFFNNPQCGDYCGMSWDVEI